MGIKLQLFGGRGSSSGGNFRGTTKTPSTSTPNSTYTWYRNGKPYQKRWYGKGGKPKLDKDYTDHRNSKRHPVNPHFHDWNKGGRGKGYWKDTSGKKHYFL